jgi:hypothetical protein
MASSSVANADQSPAAVAHVIPGFPNHPSSNARTRRSFTLQAGATRVATGRILATRTSPADTFIINSGSIEQQWQAVGEPFWYPSDYLPGRD